MEINPSKCEPIIGLKKGMSVIPFGLGEFTFLYVSQESWPLLDRQFMQGHVDKPLFVRCLAIPRLGGRLWLKGWVDSQRVEDLREIIQEICSGLQVLPRVSMYFAGESKLILKPFAIRISRLLFVHQLLSRTDYSHSSMQKV
jgi:hypothetical protein